ncbi:MAG: hypothetical protein J6K72_05735 [Clostridia bacterium]|nr:hypothetical protein [Clostridia bacterium]
MNKAKIFIKVFLSLILAIIFCLPIVSMAESSETINDTSATFSYMVTSDEPDSVLDMSQYSHSNDWSVKEGSQVTITADIDISSYGLGSDLEYSYEWYQMKAANNSWVKDQKLSSTAECKFTPVAEDEFGFFSYHIMPVITITDKSAGKQIVAENAYQTIELVRWQPPVEGTAEWDITYSHEIVDYTVTLTEGDTFTVSVDYSCDVPDADVQYSYYMYLEDADGYVYKYITNEDRRANTWSLTATKELDGNYLNITFGPQNLYDVNNSMTYYGRSIKFNILPVPESEWQIINHNEAAPYVVATTDVENSIESQSSYHGLSIWSVKEGVEVTMTLDVPMEKFAWINSTGLSPDSVVTCEWYSAHFEFDEEGTVIYVTDDLVSTENKHKFTPMRKEGEETLSVAFRPVITITDYENRIKVICEDWQYNAVEFVDWRPLLSDPIEYDFSFSHQPDGNVITVTEGETFSVKSQYSSTVNDLEMFYFLALYLEEEDSFTPFSFEKDLIFTASMEMNNRILRLEITPTNYTCIDSENQLCNESYYFRVLPKPEEELTPNPEPEEQYKLEVEEGIPEDAISEDLKANPELDTAAEIQNTMEIQVLTKATKNDMNVSVDNTKVYEVALMYSEDGGKTWIEADENNWPEEGKLTVVLPYPEGTGMTTHRFVVAHMFTTTTKDHKAGDIEYPSVINTPDGIRFEVTGLSPIAVAWEEKNKKPENVPVVPVTGDNSTPILWLVSLIIAGFVAVLLMKRRNVASNH